MSPTRVLMRTLFAAAALVAATAGHLASTTTASPPATDREATSQTKTPAKVATDSNGDPLPPGATARFGTMRLRHGQYVRSVAFSPDGKELASSSYDGAIRFWDPGTGIELRRLPSRFHSPGRIA